MTAAAKVLAWIFSAIMLIFAGVASSYILSTQSANHFIFAAAGFAVALAVAVSPPVGRRNLFVIAGLALVTIAAAFNAYNYNWWLEKHEKAIWGGLHDKVQNISIRAMKNGSDMDIYATQMVAYAPFRLVTAEDARNLDHTIGDDSKPRVSLEIDRSDDGISYSQLDIGISVLVGQAKFLHAPKDEFSDHDIDAVRTYLRGGTIVLTSPSAKLVVPNCIAYIHDLRTQPARDVPVDISAQPYIEQCSKDGKGTEDADAIARRRVADFIAAVKADPAVKLDMYGGDGTLVLTAVIPMAALNEAQQREDLMWDKVRKGDVGEPFSPFHVYLP